MTVELFNHFAISCKEPRTCESLLLSTTGIGGLGHKYEENCQQNIGIGLFVLAFRGQPPAKTFGLVLAFQTRDDGRIA